MLSYSGTLFINGANTITASGSYGLYNIKISSNGINTDITLSADNGGYNLTFVLLIVMEIVVIYMYVFYMWR